MRKIFHIGAAAACIVSMMVLLLWLRPDIETSDASPCGPGKSQQGTVSGDKPVKTFPASTYLSYPEVEFQSRETSPDHFDIGFHTGIDGFHTQAKVVLEPSRQEIAIQWLTDGCAIGSANKADSGILALEHIYGLILGSGTAASFRLDACDSAGKCIVQIQSGASQYQALRRTFDLRKTAIDRSENASRYRSWRPLEILDSSIDHDEVRARIAGRNSSIEGIKVAFSKAPHMGCFAVTDESGMAECKLEDYHGHDHQHESDDDDSQYHTVTLTGSADKGSATPPISRTFAR